MEGKDIARRAPVRAVFIHCRGQGNRVERVVGRVESRWGTEDGKDGVDHQICFSLKFFGDLCSECGDSQRGQGNDGEDTGAKYSHSALATGNKVAG